jgi:hypothetical protein
LVDFRVGTFWQMIAHAKRFDHADGGGAGVVAEKLPERSGVSYGGLEPNVSGL